MSQAKIVSLDLASRQKSEIPPVLEKLRQQSKQQLNELLQGLFNNADDALFEMSDRSQITADQEMYFDSMRELRLQRKQISRRFINRFGEGFEQAFKADEGKNIVSVEFEELDFEEALDNISLVANDDLEISVAIAGIVSKVTSQYSLPLEHLSKRIDHLCDSRIITPKLNPLGPELLSVAFVDSIRCLEVDIKVTIIILKLYERFVMERLGSIFEQSNKLLIDAGVLPELKRIHRKRRKAPRQYVQNSVLRGTAASGGSLLEDGEAFDISRSGFANIESLLAATRVEATTALPGGTGPAISTAQLLSALSAAQSDVQDGPTNSERLPAVLDLRRILATKAADVVGRDKADIGQADRDVINFVGMLFDYILNDRNLAIPMKALISRLQIPIVKIAIVDKSFFEKGNHPARQLLNELSSAGIGWSSAAELKRDAMYNKVESIVRRILNSSGQDLKLFNNLLTDLRAWVKTDLKQRNRVVQHLKETEQGKAKTTAAKEIVQKLINQKACGLRLPPAIGRFISDTWSKVLVYLCVKNGTKSPEWQRSVQVLDNLLWCLQPLASLDDLTKRDGIMLELITQLCEGMDTINTPEAARREQIESIEFQLREISQHDREFLQGDVPEDDVFAEDFEELHKVVLTESVPSREAVGSAAPEPKFLNQIKGLVEGSWVELMQEDGTRSRCRLAAVVQPGNRYVFVNRRGMKVAQKSARELAVELKQKSLTILDESQVFDRALQAVIGNLRQMRSPTDGESGKDL